LFLSFLYASSGGEKSADTGPSDAVDSGLQGLDGDQGTDADTDADPDADGAGLGEKGEMHFQAMMSVDPEVAIDGISRCEVNAFNWEGVEPRSGLPRFETGVIPVAVEEIACPAFGTSTPLDVELNIISTETGLISIGVDS
jgi:hypothetical protein